MYATLLTALVLAQAPPPGQVTQPGRDVSPRPLEGEWTVLYLERNGQEVAEAKDAKVRVENGIARFDIKDEKNKQKAMRFEFGPQNQIRVTELDEGAGDRPGGALNQPPPGAPGARPGAPGASRDIKSGVCVISKEFFAATLHDQLPTPIRPGGVVPPGAGVPPGAPPGAGQPGGVGRTLPNERPYCVVFLKRSGGGNNDNDRNK